MSGKPRQPGFRVQALNPALSGQVNPSVLQFPHLQNGASNGIHFMVWLGGLNELK